jgi:ATP-dependent RNA helicase RhlE
MNYRRRNNTPSRHTSQNRPKRHVFGGHRKQANTLDVSLLIKKAENNIHESLEPTITTPFTEFELDSKLQRNISQHGYLNPTPIQEGTIPQILEGNDVVGIANTGTGKTAAFLLPLINKSLQNRNERVLIVTPTRELAMQIVDEFKHLSVGTQLDSVLCIGGASSIRQEKKLHHNPHFIIGTPGRLIDLVKRRKLNLSLYQNVVLDEVDRMVDIGFLRDVQFLISYLPKKRQSLFFSATISDKEKAILKEFVTNPIYISVKKQETATNIDQDVIKVKSHDDKVEVLHDLLIQKEFEKVIVFGRTKWGIEKLTRNLINRGFKATSIHGNKSQGQRQRALEQFKKDEVQILLATDVASRGLDIQDVTHVINFDIPATYEDYVHRIGRTGRADKKGTALTFIE